MSAACDRCGDPVPEGRTRCFTCAQTLAGIVASVPPPAFAPPEPPAPPRDEQILAAAAGTCTRCGNFATLEVLAGAAICPECVDRLRHALLRAPFSVGAVLGGTLAASRSVGPALVLAALAQTGVSYGASRVGYFGLGVTAFGYVDLATVGFVSKSLVAVLTWRFLWRDGRLPLRHALTAAPAAFVANLLASGLVVLGFVFCLVPGVLAAAAFFLTLPIAFVERRGPSALGRSHALTTAHTGALAGVFLLTGAPQWLTTLALRVVNDGDALHGAAQLYVSYSLVFVSRLTLLVQPVAATVAYAFLVAQPPAPKTTSPS